MAVDILKESQVCLAEDKSHGLTCTLICQAFQAGKCWDNIREMLHLKLCNANIHTNVLHFMVIQQLDQLDNETLTTFVHILEQKLRGLISTVTLPPSASLFRVSGMHTLQ